MNCVNQIVAQANSHADVRSLINNATNRLREDLSSVIREVENLQNIINEKNDEVIALTNELVETKSRLLNLEKSNEELNDKLDKALNDIDDLNKNCFIVEELPKQKKWEYVEPSINDSHVIHTVW